MGVGVTSRGMYPTQGVRQQWSGCGPSLVGRCELCYAVGVEWWYFVLSTLLCRKAFRASKGLQVRGGDLVIYVGDRDDIKPHRVLLKGFR